MRRSWMLLLAVVVLTVVLAVPAAAEDTYADGGYATVNSDGIVYDMETAIGIVENSTDYITLLSDQRDVKVNKDLILDLNGCTITNLTVKDGCTLRIFDSATADFDVEDGVYGKITGTVSGTIARTVNTPEDTYGQNYRYLVIRDGEGYHSHRIWLTVKSTLLYPVKPAVNYRTVLKCDSVVAGYVNAEGGAYGLKMMANGSETAVYSAYSKAVTAWDGTGVNERVTQLENILSPDMSLEEQNLRAETVVSACAYIRVADSFGLAYQEVASANVTRSLMDVVREAEAMDADLSDAQKAALASMYITYPRLMGQASWNLSRIPQYTDYLVKYHCVCGDPAGTGTPCAEAGHPYMAWQPWTDTSTLPNVSGCWYLPEGLTFENVETASIGKDTTENVDVYVDLNGKQVTAAANCRFFDLWDNGTGNGRYSLTIIDSSAGRTGTLISTATEDNTAQALGVWVRGDWCTFNLYHGTLDGRGATLVNANGETRSGVVIANYGTVNMYGGTILGGSVEYRGGAVSNYGSFQMTDGRICGGAAEDYGGAVFISGGSFAMSGGIIENGTAAKGGNIYMKTGTLTVSGGTIQNGVVPSGGGNIRVDGGTFTMSGADTSILGGRSVANGGSVALGGGTTFKLEGGTISGGATGDTGANIYTNGLFEMTGGYITGGKARCVFNEDGSIQSYKTTEAATNVQVVGGTFDMSGGQIDGYVNVNSYTSDAFIKVSGSARILGTGLNLTHGKLLVDGQEQKDESGAILYRTIDVLTLDDLKGMDLDDSDGTAAQVSFRFTSFAAPYKDGLKLVDRGELDEATWKTYEIYADKVFTAGSTSCAVSFEEDGIWLRPASSKRWHCLCGANADETHLGDCDGYDFCWKAWTSTTLPAEPGYWYLSYGNVASKNINVGTLRYDYTANGTKVLSVLKLDEYGKVMSDGNGNYTPSGQYLSTSYELLSDVTILDEINIYLDLNGYKLDGPNRNRCITYYGRGSKVFAETDAGFSSDIDGYITETAAGKTKNVYTHRQGKVNYTIVDASEGHTAVLATEGVFNGGVYDNSNVPQGCVIWMPWKEDSLTTYYVTMDASSASQGWGVTLDTCGTVDLYESTLIGGTATGFCVEENATDSSGKVLGTVQTLKGSASGGGALCVATDGNVTMHGGTIKNGKAVYRYMSGTNGIMYDRAYGGGNVYIEGGTFSMIGGTITGGQALVEGEVNALADSMFGVGGGVYVHSGQFNISGDVNITGNTGSTGKADNVFLDGHAVNIQNASGTVGFSMTAYEGVFATADRDYYASGVLVPDGSGAENHVFAENVLRFASGSDDTYLVGYGSDLINPTRADIDTGMALNGYGNTSVKSSGSNARITNSSSTIEYDLMATALAITDGQGDTVIMINVDITSVSEAVANRVKAMISTRTGVPKDNITISASHQHSSPSVATYYWTDDDGNYTKADGTTLLAYYEPRVVKTDYATSFYTGVLNAALEAFDDRQQSTVSTGILDTTSGGKQYNFVRNVMVYKGSAYVGMWTDNHNDVKSPGSSTYTKKYETEMDTTMQLVKYDQADGTSIVLANFQTHPHLGGGSTVRHLTSDIVGVFRLELKELSGSDVIYFSGASGNVNPVTKISADTKKYPYATSVTDRVKKYTLYGESLAALTNSFLSANGNMSAFAGTKDVKVSVSTFTYDVWDESPSATKIANAKKLVNWETGVYTGYPSNFGSVWWDTMVGDSSLADEDKIYSYYHAGKIRTRLLRKEAGNMSGSFNVTAYDLGGIGFVAAPYEMFQENGQAIKGNVSDLYMDAEVGTSPYPITIVATQANGGNGYIPSAIGYVNGGYSTDTALYAPGTGEQLVEHFVDMLNELYTGE